MNWRYLKFVLNFSKNFIDQNFTFSKLLFYEDVCVLHPSMSKVFHSQFLFIRLFFLFQNFTFFLILSRYLKFIYWNSFLFSFSMNFKNHQKFSRQQFSSLGNFVHFYLLSCYFCQKIIQFNIYDQKEKKRILRKVSLEEPQKAIRVHHASENDINEKTLRLWLKQDKNRRNKMEKEKDYHKIKSINHQKKY